jgi:hypothetical protein
MYVWKAITAIMEIPAMNTGETPKTERLQRNLPKVVAEGGIYLLTGLHIPFSKASNSF